MANISGKDQHIKNQKSTWSSTVSATLDEKKTMYFGPQTKKLLTVINLQPNGLFFERLYFGPKRGWRGGGMLRSEIFTHVRDWPRLTSTHPKGDEGPPPLLCPEKSWKRKIWLKIQRARVHKFRNSGSILTKLFHATCHYCDRNFVFLNWFCTRTCGAGRPHVGLFHALLVESNTLNFRPDF